MMDKKSRLTAQLFLPEMHLSINLLYMLFKRNLTKNGFLTLDSHIIYGTNTIEQFLELE
jgi:hypothetical protein